LGGLLAINNSGQMDIQVLIGMPTLERVSLAGMFFFVFLNPSFTNGAAADGL
jgi:hypothetical protein